ncbi:MAG: DNA-binding protein [Magnetococcales bacterium]|nr:DNA-binding protein [Magnetococcales bacterium]
MSSISEEEIIQAIEAINEAGGNPTLDSVRGKVGGSFSVIGPVLSEWKKNNRVASTIDAPKIPDQILTVLERVTADLWQAATQETAEWYDRSKAAQAENQSYADALAQVKKEQSEFEEKFEREQNKIAEAHERLINKMSDAREREQIRANEAYKDMETKLTAKINKLENKLSNTYKKLAVAEDNIKTLRASLAVAKREVRSKVVKWSGAT